MTVDAPVRPGPTAGRRRGGRVAHLDSGCWYAGLHDGGDVVNSAHRERVAAELKRIREALGVSGEEVAAALGWSQPKVSRVENARIAVSVRDLATLLHYYGVPEEVRAELLTMTADDQGLGGAWIVRAGGPPRRQREVAALESRLAVLRQYYPLMIPGQLQSPAYALAHLRAGGWPDPESIVARRMHRQELLASPNGPQYVAVLDARAFLAWPGTTETISDQVAHLRRRAALPNVTVLLIPLGIGRRASAMTPFTIYEFVAATSPQVVFIESQTADLYLSSPHDVETYADLFERLRGDALNESDSLDYLASLTDHVKDLESLRSP